MRCMKCGCLPGSFSIIRTEGRVLIPCTDREAFVPLEGRGGRQWAAR